MDKPIFQNAELFRLWAWCLMKATHTETEQLVGLQKVKLKPGQFITGRYAGAKELGMNPSTFWKYLLTLKTNQSLDIKSNNKFSLVTVVNWEFYNGSDAECDSKCDSKMTTKRQQRDTNKNVNNLNLNLNSLSIGDDKKQFAEFVWMTDKEYQSLIERFGEEKARRCIEELDNAKGAKGYKYKSDYRAILKWVIKRVEEEEQWRGGMWRDQRRDKPAGKDPMAFATAADHAADTGPL